MPDNLTPNKAEHKVITTTQNPNQFNHDISTQVSIFCAASKSKACSEGPTPLGRARAEKRVASREASKQETCETQPTLKQPTKEWIFLTPRDTVEQCTEQAGKL